MLASLNYVEKSLESWTAYYRRVRSGTTASHPLFRREVLTGRMHKIRSLDGRALLGIQFAKSPADRKVARSLTFSKPPHEEASS